MRRSPRRTSKACSARWMCHRSPAIFSRKFRRLAPDLDDPTTRFDRLDIVGRRLLLDPAAALRRARGSTRSSSVGRRSGRAGGSRRVAPRASCTTRRAARSRWRRECCRRHAARPCAVAKPLEGLPALGDDNVGQRLRARLVREAAAVIVTSDAVGRSARQLVRVRRDHLRIILARHRAQPSVPRPRTPGSATRIGRRRPRRAGAPRPAGALPRLCRTV